MEEQLLLEEHNIIKLEHPKSTPRNLIKYLLIISTIIVILLFSLLFYWNKQTNSKLSLALNEINTLKTEKDKIDFSFDIKLLNIDAFVNKFQHSVEGGIATDDFIVEKITATVLPVFSDKAEDKGFLRSTIDLFTQPGGKSGYEGKGKFTATDRELKSMILDVLDKVKAEYGPIEGNPNELPEWEVGIHYITIKNYEIGTFEKGVFKLKGE